jgi:hypothetical protein
VSLAELFRFLFLEQSEIVPNILHPVIMATEKFCLEKDAEVSKVINLPLSRLLGQAYFARLEASTGILSVPYAVLIACHVPELNLAPLNGKPSVRVQVEKELRANPDTRLAMLSGIDPHVRYNPAALATAAWERLKLEAPEEYFR